MASHGIPLTSRTRTEEQKVLDLEKIKKYRALEDEIRQHITQGSLTQEVFPLTTKLLKLNPEYYTIWNVRRRLLISGLLSKPSAGSWPSRALPTSSPTDTTTPSSAAFSSSSSTATPQGPGSRKAGKNGTTAETSSGGPETVDSSKRETSADGREGTVDTKAVENDFAVLQSELAFILPLLQEYPKCYWIWSYRGWVLQQAIERLDTARARSLWEVELALDSKMLAKDRRNYHAWAYRRLVVDKLESPVLNGKSMVESEFEYTSRMIRVDLSNFSAWHNRSKLIPRLLEERGADDLSRKNFLMRVGVLLSDPSGALVDVHPELSQIHEALNVGPEDQSLWYYHQFLMQNIFEPVGRPTITPGFSLEDRVTYAVRELDAMNDLLEDYDDVKWIYEALMESTIALCYLQDRQPVEEEKDSLRTWLTRLKKLDPMRNGRWVEIERNYDLL